MKFNIGESLLDKILLVNRYKRKLHWHKWFAWRPIVVGRYPNGRRNIVWLEYVKRKGHQWSSPDGIYMDFNYKELTNDT